MTLKELVEPFNKSDWEALSDTHTEVRNILYNISKIEKKLEYTGKKATVKTGTGWIYEGHTFNILSINSVDRTKLGIYPFNSAFLKLDLKGTEFEFRFGVRQTYTVINEKDLIIV